MERGIGFDASNFGFAEVDRSDKILKPDLKFAFEDPIDDEHRILCFFCNMLEVDTNARFTQDLRHLVPKTLELLEVGGNRRRSQGRGGIGIPRHRPALFSVRNPREQSFRVETSEMVSPPGGEEVYRIAPKRGYFRAEPNDHLFSIRSRDRVGLPGPGFGRQIPPPRGGKLTGRDRVQPFSHRS